MPCSVIFSFPHLSCGSLFCVGRSATRRTPPHPHSLDTSGRRSRSLRSAKCIGTFAALLACITAFFIALVQSAAIVFQRFVVYSWALCTFHPHFTYVIPTSSSVLTRLPSGSPLCSDDLPYDRRESIWTILVPCYSTSNAKLFLFSRL